MIERYWIVFISLKNVNGLILRGNELKRENNFTQTHYRFRREQLSNLFLHIIFSERELSAHPTTKHKIKSNVR